MKEHTRKNTIYRYGDKGRYIYKQTKYTEILTMLLRKQHLDEYEELVVVDS